MKHAEKTRGRRVRSKGADAMTARKSDALELVTNIIADKRVAEKFFFRTMRPKMKALADECNRSHGLGLTADDVATATYISCWENDWARLRAFRGETTTSAWVARIASQAVHRQLAEERCIADAGEDRAFDRIDDEDVCENHIALRETLTDLYGNEDWDDNVERLIMTVVAGLEWNRIQRTVWKERFFEDTPSKELALRLEMRNTWIDNTYSRLNKQFRAAVRMWWNRHIG